MRTDFSEFSYGYAITEELMRGVFSGLRIAPIFPSLIEEGRAGGGYDVKFDAPGRILYLQFKRPDVMVRRTAEEVQDGYESLFGGLPIYRMHIRSHGTSRQHDLLLGLDDGSADVFYSTPCFHSVGELNARYGLRSIVDGSLWIAPKVIGPLSSEPHRVSYGRSSGAVLYSQPIKLDVPRSDAVGIRLINSIAEDTRNLMDGVVEQAWESGLKVLRERGVTYREREPRPDEKTRTLARLADLAVSYFSVQMFVVQHDDESAQ